MGVSEGAVQRTVPQLEAELDKVTAERDALRKDVETLCLHEANTATFNASSVLSMRAEFAETELSKLRAALEAAEEQIRSFQEDGCGLREAKRSTDEAYRELRSRAGEQERELAFFREQAGKAALERQRAIYDLAQVRSGAAELEKRVARQSSRLAAAAVARKEAEEGLERERRRMREETEALERELVASRAEFCAARASADGELARARALEAALDAARAELEGGRSLFAREQAAERAAQQKTHRERLAELQRRHQEELDRAAAELEESRHGRELAQAASAGAARRAARCEQELGLVQEALRRAISEKGEAQQRLAAADGDRVLLEEVAEGKVSALLRLSELEAERMRLRSRAQALEERLRALGAPDSSPDKSPPLPRGRSDATATVHSYVSSVAALLRRQVGKTTEAGGEA